MNRSTTHTPIRWIALLLVAGALVVLAPMWPALLCAAWLAAMTRPALLRLSRALGGRHRAAAAVTVVVFLALLLPLAFIAISLSSSAVDLAKTVASSGGGRNALRAIVSSGSSSGFKFTSTRIIDFVKEYGLNLWGFLQVVAGATAEGLLGLFVFLLGTYTFLVDGPDAYVWMRERAPIEEGQLDRLVAAFHETGRGLLIGVGLTGLAQGIVATVTYLALGIPRALVLGLVTCFASLIPSIGTALVWVPVAAGLALTGRSVAAIVLTAVGLLVIGTVDNVLRPVFSRYGRLNLPTFVLLISMFGGLAVVGSWGLVLGPLAVRLAVEAVDIVRDARERSA